MRTLRYASIGFLLGISWGVVGRAWMRLISMEPSFSWGGTLLLVGMTGVAGLMLGFAHAARLRGGSPWWRLVLLVVAFLFAGAGLPLLPAVAIGGWAMRRGLWGRVVAGLALLSAPVILVVMTWEEVTHSLTPYPENIYRLVLAGGGLLLSGTAAWASSTVLGPWRPRAAQRIEAEALADAPA